MKQFTVEFYVDEDGKIPVEEFLNQKSIAKSVETACRWNGNDITAGVCTEGLNMTRKAAIGIQDFEQLIHKHIDN